MATGPVSSLCSPFPVIVNGVRVARVSNYVFGQFYAFYTILNRIYQVRRCYCCCSKVVVSLSRAIAPVKTPATTIRHGVRTVSSDGRSPWRKFYWRQVSNIEYAISMDNPVVVVLKSKIFFSDVAVADLGFFADVSLNADNYIRCSATYPERADRQTAARFSPFWKVCEKL